MIKEDYITTLKRSLSTLPESDIADICGDFEEHFAIGLSQGKTEHEISAELGDPAAVAATYFDEGLENIGHTMEESRTHTAAAAAAAASAAAAKSPAFDTSGKPAAEGASAGFSAEGASRAPAANKEKDLTGARVFVILLNILLTWWVALTIFTTILSFWLFSVSLLVGGIGAFTGLAASSGGWISVLVLIGAASILLAAATGILNFFLTKWSIIGCREYVKWNRKLYNEGF